MTKDSGRFRFSVLSDIGFMNVFNIGLLMGPSCKVSICPLDCDENECNVHLGLITHIGYFNFGVKKHLPYNLI